MNTKEFQNYAIGFLFNKDLTKVALINKNKPGWQKGKLNGIGGKIGHEKPICAMCREFEEETGKKTTPHDWIHFAEIYFSYGIVYCYYAVDELSITDEEIIIVDVANIPLEAKEDMLYNVPGLISLALAELAAKWEKAVYFIGDLED